MYVFEPIGVIRSCFAQKFGIPRQPGLAPAARAVLELAPPYGCAEAVAGLEGFSHLWVVFVFHADAHRGWRPTVRPPRLGGNRRVGVFASRSGFRPNPIGLSVVGLNGVRRRGDRALLDLTGGDFLDGTPVLDVKPYLAYADSLPDAVAGFAPQPPSPLPVEFSAEAQAACRRLAAAGGTDPGQLIAQVLANDPRPAYHAARARSRPYGLRLAAADVRWRVVDGRVRVLDVAPVAPRTQRKEDGRPMEAFPPPPAAGEKILVCGKGGSGKSTLAALIATGLRDLGRRVLLMDADESNVGLHRLLGFDRPRPLLDHLGGKAGLRRRSAPALPGGPARPLFQGPMRPADLPAECLVGGDGLRLAAIGKIEHFGEGCACPMGALARSVLEALALEEGEVALVDTAAGVEHFGRRIDGLCDRLIAVVDPTAQSFDLLGRIRRLAEEAGRPLWVVLNKTEPDTEALMRRQAGDASVVGAVPARRQIFADSLAGRPFDSRPPEIDAICERIRASAEGFVFPTSGNEEEP